MWLGGSGVEIQILAPYLWFFLVIFTTTFCSLLNSWCYSSFQELTMVFFCLLNPIYTPYQPFRNLNNLFISFFPLFSPVIFSGPFALDLALFSHRPYLVSLTISSHAIFSLYRIISYSPLSIHSQLCTFSSLQHLVFNAFKL